MSDQPVVPPPPAASPSDPDQPTDFDISEEYGTARKNLPPLGILAICLAVVVVVVAAYVLTHRARSVSTGSIDGVASVEVPGQDMVMVAVNVSIQNNEDKPLWIKSMQVAADVNGNQLSDEASPAVDAQRYLQTFPELQQHALKLLSPEMQVSPRSKLSGTVVASFQLKADAFAGRKSLTVTVTPYDELPIIITK